MTDFLASLGFERATYQTKPERAGCTDRPTILHGPHGAVAKRLQALNERGSSIHFSVHHTDLRGRKEENITRVGLVVADDVPLYDEYPLEPTAIVETSAGNHSAFWRVEGMAKEIYPHVLTHVAILLGADMEGHMLNKTMRLPGYWHMKADPFLSRVAHLEPGAVYSAEQFLDVFSIPEPEPKPVIPPLPEAARAFLSKGKRTHPGEVSAKLLERVALAPEGQRNGTLYRVASAVANDVAAGQVDHASAFSALTNAGLACGLEAHEVASTLKSAMRYAEVN